VKRVAAVDLGTNSTRLLVADVEDGTVEEVVRRTVVTRLGEGVDARRRLLPVPVARVRNVLSDFRREAEALGAERTLAVATSAVRDAENGEAFLGEVEWSYGFATRLLSGDEEAALTRAGVGRVAADTLLLDVGGGSTELVAGDSRTSLDIGSVRVTERHLHGDPPTGAELAAAAAAVHDLLPALEVRAALGVAGTVGQLAVLLGGGTMRLSQIEALLDRLAAMTLDERRALPGLDPARAPVIVGGALIVREVLRRYDLDEIEFSVRDLLDGAALAAADLPAQDEGAAPPGAYTCC
jgi:exopolyphosphatase / guanosine-5'-triphosphate,3'-diphosphate pyrophosphatase